ncbi:SLC13 family permease [Sphingorhabdus arenilitoris]|uniref:SLC13 family permease n=1 Tax=Sphingorhabdus arenilitoris TaxID=1490041 RepID=A0ABV8RH44_9SPHN
MIDIPSPHAAAALILTVLVFYAFASGKARIEIISLLTIGVIALGLYFAPLPGTQPKDGLVLAFEGFGHPALITICALMIMGRGLVVTGALDPAARALRSVWRVNKQLGLLVTLMMAFGASMIINDTPVLVLLLPIMVQLASQGAMPASKTLIPINAAILIGGMATTIGTSTNLLVVSIANDLGMRPISVFHYSDIVLMAALVALPYIWLVMPRLLPDNSKEAGHYFRKYYATLRLGPQSAMFDRDATAIAALLPPDVTIDKNTRYPLVPGGRLRIRGTQEGIEEAMRLFNATAVPAWLDDQLRFDAGHIGEDITIAEMAVGTDSRLIGRTLQTAGLSEVGVMGVDQARKFIHDKRPRNAEAELREGDVLLVMGTAQYLQDFARNEGMLVLEGAKELPRSNKATLALVIMIGSVALASAGFLPIAISALGGAVLMFVTGCVKFERVGRALSAKVIVLVAASLAIGKIVLVSGAAEWMGSLLALGLQFLPAAGVLAAIMLFVTILTNFASNATAAAVGTPIAFSLATQLGLPVEPMVLAVLFGCNLCYATPVAYQTNMLIMAEGEYKFKDYIRTGVPLVVIMIVTLSTLLVLKYDI